jgi:hypothetical protein
MTKVYDRNYNAIDIIIQSDEIGRKNFWIIRFGLFEVNPLKASVEKNF